LGEGVDVLGVEWLALLELVGEASGGVGGGAGLFGRGEIVGRRVHRVDLGGKLVEGVGELTEGLGGEGGVGLRVEVGCCGGAGLWSAIAVEGVGGGEGLMEGVGEGLLLFELALLGEEAVELGL